MRFSGDLEGKLDAACNEVLPFLKWAGGKRWLSASLAPVIAKCQGTYFEPFLGSAAVFFFSRPKNAVLSDVNEELIECYKSIRDCPKGVQAELDKLAELDPSLSYYDIRSSRPVLPCEKAARFLYLNRTCWNGLYRVNLKGEFNVPRGSKTQIIMPKDDFEQISKILKGTKIQLADFEKIIEKAGSGDIVFADPPYTVAHNSNGFIKYNQKIFSWDDQQRLAQSLISAAFRGAKIISTNADHPEILKLYKQHFDASPICRASIIAASSSNRRQTTELLISNKGMNIA